MSALSSEALYWLSKSKIAAFEHCPKRLWLQIHRREEGRFDPDTLARFKIGHDVGAKAQQLVPGGVLVEAIPDIQAALDRTSSLLATEPSRPIFEATFQREDVLVRADILEPDGQGGWRAIEVKASTRVKAYQLADLATQVWVMQGCGVSVTGALIRHLAAPIIWSMPDMSAVRFRDTDVTLPISRYLENRASVAADARKAIRGAEIELDMGRHCQFPFKCEFQEHCTKLRDLPLLAASARQGHQPGHPTHDLLAES